MAYVQMGRGIPIVFLHGNPTSSFLWRNVLPGLEGFGRLIAPDLIGMGDSEKLLSSEQDRYRFASHAKYLEEFMRQVIGTDKVVLVLHDWGGALGFNWAYKNQEKILGIAYMETFVCPLSLADLPESFHETLNGVRSEAGERMVLEQNLFIEGMLPSLIQRSLSDAELDEYRRPFKTSGDDRLPTLQWPREVPIDGNPSDVAQLIANYSKWLSESQIPKLFINADPGVFITGRVRKLCSDWPNQQEVTVNGLHFLPEDSPEAVARAVARWLKHL
jgi:haloalkane dehalogenase